MAPLPRVPRPHRWIGMRRTRRAPQRNDLRFALLDGGIALTVLALTGCSSYRRPMPGGTAGAASVVTEQTLDMNRLDPLTGC